MSSFFFFFFLFPFVTKVLKMTSEKHWSVFSPELYILLILVLIPYIGIQGQSGREDRPPDNTPDHTAEGITQS